MAVQEALMRLLIMLQTPVLGAFYLPFLLIFAILFGLLEKIKIFGDISNRINVVLSLVISAYIMLFSPLKEALGMFFLVFFAQTSVALVVLLSVMLLLGMVLSNTLFPSVNFTTKYSEWVAGAGVIIALFLFYNSGGFDLLKMGGPSLPIISSDDIVFLLLIAGLLGLIFWVKGSELTEAEKATRKSNKEKPRTI